MSYAEPVQTPNYRPRHRPPLYRPAPSYGWSRRRRLRLIRTLLVAAALVVLTVVGVLRALHPRIAPVVAARPEPSAAPPPRPLLPPTDGDGIKVGTFLGGPERRVYGIGPAPKQLHLVWKLRIGEGWTSRKSDGKSVLWAGTGWTGQPTLVRDGGRDWLLVGGYDHGLRKIDAATGKVAWRHGFDDVIKGTNTVFRIRDVSGKSRTIVVSGSRRGSDLAVGDSRIAPLRALDFETGRELWRLPVPKTANYSQDVDASPLLLGGSLYAAVEPGVVYRLDPLRTVAWKGHRRPVVLARSPLLYTAEDVRRHPDVGGANLAIEGSPTFLGGLLYVTSGAGHVWGLRPSDLEPVWDFRTGSDIDSTPATTRTGNLLVGIEKEYVPGPGGVVMLDPRKPPEDAVVWYYPTAERGIGEWAGGVVGSIAVNDEYDPDGRRPALAAFTSVDGSLYVVTQRAAGRERVVGPRGTERYRTPKLVFQSPIGAGISTPVFVDDALIATGYDKKVHLYAIRYGPAGRGPGVDVRCRDGETRRVSFRETSSFATGGSLESTPLVWHGRVYVGSRDGWLYCLGG